VPAARPFTTTTANVVVALSFPDEEILDSVFVDDPYGCLAGDVEVDLAAGFGALADGGSAHRNNGAAEMAVLSVQNVACLTL
jgi:hypothetical protein